jgi:hypothetical protein
MFFPQLPTPSAQREALVTIRHSQQKKGAGFHYP